MIDEFTTVTLANDHPAGALLRVFDSNISDPCSKKRQLIVKQLDHDQTPVAGLPLVEDRLKVTAPVLARLDASLSIGDGLSNGGNWHGCLNILLQGKSELHVAEYNCGNAFAKQALKPAGEPAFLPRRAALRPAGVRRRQFCH